MNDEKTPAEASKPPVEWTADEQQKLHHEEFIKEIISARADAKKSEPVWLKILNSTGFSTFMTVVIGGLVIQLIVSSWQANQTKQDAEKERDRQRSQQRYDVVKSAVELISKLTHATNVYVENTKQGTSVQPDDAIDRDLRIKEIEGLRQGMHGMIEQWRVTEGTMSFWMVSAYKDRSDVIESWDATRKSVNDYLSCVALIDQKYSVDNAEIKPEVYKACDVKKEELGNSLKRFATILN